MKVHLQTIVEGYRIASAAAFTENKETAKWHVVTNRNESIGPHSG